jgi:hypothetical protein
LLEKQMLDEIANSLEHAAATFTPALLGVDEIAVLASTGRLEIVADQVVTIASRLGGSAAKGVPDQGRLSVLVDVPSNREAEFRAAVSSITGKSTPTSTTSAATGATAEKKSFVVQIVEAAAGGPK